jgi:hypothetical protein
MEVHKHHISDRSTVTNNRHKVPRRRQWHANTVTSSQQWKYTLWLAVMTLYSAVSEKPAAYPEKGGQKIHRYLRPCRPQTGGWLLNSQPQGRVIRTSKQLDPQKQTLSLVTRSCAVPPHVVTSGSNSHFFSAV